MTTEPGLRERKKVQTRERIEAAALGLFASDGFVETTVAAVATAAEIAERTFFYYYPTKEDVVLADYASRLDRIVAELSRQAPADPPWRALRSAFLTVAADYDVEREQLIQRFQIVAANPSVYARSLQLQAGWEDALAAALAQRMGCGAENLRPRLLASSALSALRSAQHHWMATDQTDVLPKLVEECFDQLASGLADVG